MRMLSRSFARLAALAVLGFAALVGASSVNAAGIDQALPDSTLAYIEIKNISELRNAFNQTSTGKMIADAEMKPFLDSIKEKMDKPNADVKKRLGVDLYQLLNIPQGNVTIAVVVNEKSKPPVGLIVTADAGKNAEQMADLMAKLNKLAEDEGSKVSTEDFQGAKLTSIKGKNAGEDEPVLGWTNKGSVYYIGVGVDALKGVLSKSQGREDSLANSDVYKKARKKHGESQVFGFVDFNNTLKTIIENAPDGNLQQAEGILQAIGVNNIKSLSGSLNFNVEGFDQTIKLFMAAPQPAQGILRMIQMPKIAMKPEAWVAAAVSNYQSQSWDLDELFESVNDMVNQFVPGALNNLEQQLAGDGDPISFQKDVFGPLGDRISIITNPKPNQKATDQPPTLVGIALEDSKAFQSTLNKIIKLAGGKPEERDFQGTKIMDFSIPEIPNAQGFPDKVSIAIAKDTLFVATEPKLLEQALQGGGPTLADSDEFKKFAKLLPETVSSLTFARPEVAAKAAYDMIKGGQFDEALEPARATGMDIPKLSEVLDLTKLPSFDFFKKYITSGGGYWLQDDDGTAIINFSVKPQKP